MIVCFLLLVGCSSPSAEEELFYDFTEKLIESDYEGMYQLLSRESRESITEEDFVIRYTNIYAGIGARNFEFDRGEVKEGKIPFSMSMDTLAGEVELDFYFTFVEEDGEVRVAWTEALIFPTMKAGDLIRIESEAARRGNILDRYGEMLATEGVLSEIGLHPENFDDELIGEVAEILDISPEVIVLALDTVINPDHFLPIVRVLPDASILEDLRNREGEGILIVNTEGRVYKNHEAFGRLLGFVAPITAEDLAADEEGIYNFNSIVGQAGLEQVHESTLRGIDGIEIFIERDGINVETIVKRPIQHGDDLVLTIDSTLQILTYETMNNQRGSAAAVDPLTGEVLALVSSPSYNSNLFTTYTTLSEQLRREEMGFADEKNRFSTVYSPGSTFKLHTAVIGLENGIIDPTEVKSIYGREWQASTVWGNYNIRRVNSQTRIGLREAIKFSDNIYFAMQVLNMGSEAFLDGMESFTIGNSLDIGFPLGQSQISNDGNLDYEILLADTGYGQGEILATTLNIALDYSMLSNNGSIMNPTLILTDSFEPSYFREFLVSTENLEVLQDAFVAVIADSDGTGNLSFIDGIELAGKTGTAELSLTQDEDGSENGWFVATDLDGSRISIAVMIEDAQDHGGTLNVVRMVRDILSQYLNN